jgi:hypothetical protein
MKITEANKKEIRRFINTYLKLLQCLFLVLGFAIIILFLFDFIFPTDFIGYFYYSPWDTKKSILAILYSAFGLAWIIRDGEFIGDIKSSHWFYKDKLINKKMISNRVKGL